MDYRRYIVALREFGKVGPKGFQQLLLRFGSPDNVFLASPEEISSLPRVSREKAETILSARARLQEADQMLENMEAKGIQIATILDEGYPELLKQIADPPPLLYYHGAFPINGTSPFIALVGTTQASEGGIARAVALGKRIATEGGVVVSGLARGIDSAGHVGALAKSGKNYAVLGSGLNSIYPPENSILAKSIAQSGAVLTEYSPGVPVNIGQLMARNRIVVGLSQAVILVEESPESEGSADAANRALEIGRPLFVASDCSTAPFWKEKGGVVIKGEDDFDLVLGYL